MVKKVIIQKANKDNEERLDIDMELPPVDCVVFELDDGRTIMVQPTSEGLYIENMGQNWWSFTDWKEID